MVWLCSNLDVGLGLGVCRTQFTWRASRKRLASFLLTCRLRFQVVGVPIPIGAAAEGAKVEAAIESALIEAEDKKIEGQAVTPFLL